MLSSDKMNRINELARKGKSIGLTKEEQTEQQLLRQEYIEAFRADFRKQLDNIKFVDDEADTPPGSGRNKSH